MLGQNQAKILNNFAYTHDLMLFLYFKLCYRHQSF